MPVPNAPPTTMSQQRAPVNYVAISVINVRMVHSARAVSPDLVLTNMELVSPASITANSASPQPPVSSVMWAFLSPSRSVNLVTPVVVLVPDGIITVLCVLLVSISPMEVVSLVLRPLITVLLAKIPMP